MSVRSGVAGLSEIIKRTNSSRYILLPRYNEWLLNHSDEPLTEEIANKIYEQLTATPRKRPGTLSASSASFCTRRQLYGYLGIKPDNGKTPDKRLMNIFNDGKWRHLRLQANLFMAGLITHMEFSAPWHDKRSFGTIDATGIVYDDHPRDDWRGAEFLVEIKGINAYDYSKCVRADKPKTEHIAQVHRYFLHTGVELASILYENKADNTMHEWVIERDDDLIAESLEELDYMNECIDNKTLPAIKPACRAHIGKEWEGCPYAGINGVCERITDWDESGI